MYRTAKDQGKGEGKGNTFETDLSHHPLQLSPLKKSSDNTPSGRYGVAQLLTTVPSAPDDKKHVANQDLMVRMIRICVGLITGQKGTAQGHAGKIRFIKLVTSALERRGC